VKLRNQEIWLAYSNLAKVWKLDLPAKTSLDISYILSKLQTPYLVIENERKKLIRKYGVLHPDGKQISVDPGSENEGDYSREFAEVLVSEWPDEFEFEKVKVQSSIIDANTLLPLREKILEVEEV